MRIALILVALVVAAAGAAAFAIPGVVPWGQERAQLDWVLSRLRAPPLTFDGALRYRLLPQPQLEAEAVSLHDPGDPDAPPLATVQRLRARLSLAELLKGNLVVRSLTLEGASLMLPAPPADASGPLPVVLWPALDGLPEVTQGELIDARILPRGAAGPPLLQAVGGTFSLTPAAGALSATVSGDRPRGDGRVEVMMALGRLGGRPTLNLNRVILSAPGRPDTTLAGALSPAAGEANGLRGTLAIATRSGGRPLALEGLVSLTGQDLALNEVDGQWGSGAGQTALAGSASWPLGGEDDGAPAQLNLELSGEPALTADLLLAPVPAGLSRPVALTVTARGARIAALPLRDLRLRGLWWPGAGRLEGSLTGAVPGSSRFVAEGTVRAAAGPPDGPTVTGPPDGPTVTGPPDGATVTGQGRVALESLAPAALLEWLATTDGPQAAVASLIARPLARHGLGTGGLTLTATLARDDPAAGLAIDPFQVVIDGVEAYGRIVIPAAPGAAIDMAVTLPQLTLADPLAAQAALEAVDQVLAQGAGDPALSGRPLRASLLVGRLQAGPLALADLVVRRDPLSPLVLVARDATAGGPAGTGGAVLSGTLGAEGRPGRWVLAGSTPELLHRLVALACFEATACRARQALLEAVLPRARAFVAALGPIPGPAPGATAGAASAAVEQGRGSVLRLWQPGRRQRLRVEAPPLDPLALGLGQAPWPAGSTRVSALGLDLGRLIAAVPAPLASGLAAALPILAGADPAARTPLTLAQGAIGLQVPATAAEPLRIPWLLLQIAGAEGAGPAQTLSGTLRLSREGGLSGAMAAARLRLDGPGALARLVQPPVAAAGPEVVMTVADLALRAPLPDLALGPARLTLDGAGLALSLIERAPMTGQAPGQAPGQAAAAPGPRGTVRLSRDPGGRLEVAISGLPVADLGVSLGPVRLSAGRLDLAAALEGAGVDAPATALSGTLDLTLHGAEAARLDLNAALAAAARVDSLAAVPQALRQALTAGTLVASRLQAVLQLRDGRLTPRRIALEAPRAPVISAEGSLSLTGEGQLTLQVADRDDASLALAVTLSDRGGTGQLSLEAPAVVDRLQRAADTARQRREAELEARLAEARRQTAVAEQALAARSRDLEALQVTLRDQADAARAEQQRLAQEVAGLTGERDRLSSRLQQAAALREQETQAAAAAEAALRQSLTQLESARDAALARARASEQALGTLQGRLAALEATLTQEQQALQGELARAERDAAARSQEVASLRETVATLEARLADATAARDAATQAEDERQQAIDRQARTAGALIAERDQLAAQLAGALSARRQAEQERDRIARDLGDAQAALAAATASGGQALDQLRDQLARTQAERAALTQQVQRLQAALDQTADQGADLRGAAVAAEQARDALQATVQARDETIASLTQARDRLQAQVEAQLAAQQAAERTRAELETSLTQLRSAAESAQAEGLRLGQDLATLRQSLAAVTQDRDRLQTLAGAATEERARLSAALDQAQAALAQGGATEAELRQDLAAARSRVAALEAEGAALAERLAAAEAALGDVGGARDAAETALAAALEAARQRQAMISDLSAARDQLTADLAAAQAQAARLAAMREDLAGQLQAAQTDLAALREQAATTATERAALATQLEAAEADLAALREQAATTATERAALATQLEAAEADLARAQAAERAAITAQGQLEAALSQRDAVIARLEQTVEQRTALTRDQEAELGRLAEALEAARIDRQEALVASERARADAQQAAAQVTALEGRLAGLQANLAARQTLEARLSTVVEERDRARAMAAEAEQALRATAQALAAREEELARLEDALTGAETRLQQSEAAFERREDRLLDELRRRIAQLETAQTEALRRLQQEVAALRQERQALLGAAAAGDGAAGLGAAGGAVPALRTAPALTPALPRLPTVPPRDPPQRIPALAPGAPGLPEDLVPILPGEEAADAGPAPGAGEAPIPLVPPPDTQ